jgi:hypothetical protein
VCMLQQASRLERATAKKHGPGVATACPPSAAGDELICGRERSQYRGLERVGEVPILLLVPCLPDSLLLLAGPERAEQASSPINLCTLHVPPVHVPTVYRQSSKPRSSRSCKLVPQCFPPYERPVTALLTAKLDASGCSGRHPTLSIGYSAHLLLAPVPPNGPRRRVSGTDGGVVVAGYSVEPASMSRCWIEQRNVCLLTCRDLSDPAGGSPFNLLGRSGSMLREGSRLLETEQVGCDGDLPPPNPAGVCVDAVPHCCALLYT